MHLLNVVMVTVPMIAVVILLIVLLQKAEKKERYTDSELVVKTYEKVGVKLKRKKMKTVSPEEFIKNFKKNKKDKMAWK